MKYYVSIRVYDENDDYEGVEWKLTKNQAMALEKEINERFGVGTEV